jgi:hypothetical protein
MLGKVFDKSETTHPQINNTTPSCVMPHCDGFFKGLPIEVVMDFF